MKSEYPKDLKIHNSLSGKKKIFIPIDKNNVGMYVCGPTVYNNAHLGNCRTFISFDLIYRYLTHLGYKVRYVRNLTDVGHLENEDDSGEDKVLKKARLEKLEPMEVVQKYTLDFHSVLKKLNTIPPNIEPTASGHIIEQIDSIKQIVESGFAYEKNGSVYFDILKFNESNTYGKLSGRKIEDMMNISRALDGISDKKNPQDFALWKKAEKIKELSRQGDRQLTNPFSLGLIYSIAPYLLPLIIPILRKDLPSMSLEVEENITKNLEEHLKKGGLDAAIIALPFEKPGIECIHLYDEAFEVIVPINHQLAKNLSLSAKEIGREKVMLLDNNHCYSNQILEACPGLVENRDVQLGNSLETIRNMVASNLGISVLPKSATISGYENPLVKTIPFSDPKPYRRVALAYRKSTVKKDAINYIVKSIHKINLHSILN